MFRLPGKALSQLHGPAAFDSRLHAAGSSCRWQQRSRSNSSTGTAWLTAPQRSGRSQSEGQPQALRGLGAGPHAAGLGADGQRPERSRSSAAVRQRAPATAGSKTFHGRRSGHRSRRFSFFSAAPARAVSYSFAAALPSTPGALVLKHGIDVGGSTSFKGRSFLYLSPGPPEANEAKETPEC